MTTTESFILEVIDQHQTALIISALSASIRDLEAQIVSDDDHELTQEEVRWNAFVDERCDELCDLLDLFDMAARIEAIL